MAKNINGSFLHVGKTEQIGQQIIQNYGPDREELEKLCNDMAEQLLGELPVKISQETRAIVGEIVHDEITAVLLRIDEKAKSEEDFRKSVFRNFEDLRKDMQSFKAELKEQFDAFYDDVSDELENLERLSRDAAHQADEAFGKIIKTLSAMKDIAQEFKETIRLDYTFELLQGWASIREGWFDTAKEFFDKASRQMANEAEAYFGMYLADCKIQVLWDCVNCRWQPIFHDTVALDTKLDNNPYCNKAMQVANIGQKTEYEAFNDEIRYIKEEFEKLEDDGVDYDCFICVKVSDKDEKFTEDSKDAEGIYQLLSNPSNGFKPFYSKCTLKNTTGKNDEAHILYALYKAKCLIVVCSNREYLKTPWVKNEYTRYIDMMNAGDKSRDSIFIASCGTTIRSHQLGMSRSIQSRKYDRTNLQDNFNLGKEIVDFVGKFVKNNTGVGIENNSDAERIAREKAEAKVRELEKKLEEERNAREKNAREVREETEHQAREKGAQAKLRKFVGDVKPERKVSDEKIKVEALPADYPTLQNYNNQEFEIEGTILKKYKGEGKEVKIPNGVTSIGRWAFQVCTGLTSIVIPNGVTSIGNCAFYDCTRLSSITIPDSVMRIGYRAFSDCISLHTVYYEGTRGQWDKIAISDNNDELEIAKRYYNVNAEQADVQARENQAAAESVSKNREKSKTESKYPDEKVKPNALPADYPTLQNYNKGEFEIEGTLLKKYKGEGKEVKIPNGVTSIGAYAFQGCESLTSIIIPNSVTRLGFGAFEDCTALKSITIPNSIKSIDGDVFRKCKMLTSIAIPNSVTSIEKNPFENCEALESITVEEGNPNYKAEGNCLIEKKTGKLLAGCKSSVIPNGVTSIGDAAFSGCAELMSIIIPNGVTSIGDSAFWGCEGLTSIIIPNSATSIGDAAFYGCKGLTSIIIPNSVTGIGKNPFKNCEALESITVEEENPEYKAEGNCLIEKKTGKLLAGCKSSIIPSGVTSIGEEAFSLCRGLTSIIIPNGVTSIGRGAFYGCMWLKSIAIPTSVTRIGGRAFYICTNLQTVYYEGTSEQWDKIAISDENDELKNAKRYYNVTAEQAEVIKARENQAAAESASKKEEESKTERKDPDEKVKPDALPADYPTLENYNKGEFEIEGTILKKCKKKIGKVKIPYGVTSIGGSAFLLCKGLPSIIIPNSVTSIRDYAFWGCAALTSIIIPSSVTNIGENPFGYCTALESITVEDENPEYKDEGNCLIEKKTGKLLAGCKWSVIPNGVTSIGDAAFFGCKGLTRIVISNSVHSIEASAFHHCSNLHIVYYEGTIEQWNKIEISDENDDLICATRYYYSKRRKLFGKYWHWDERTHTLKVW